MWGGLSYILGLLGCGFRSHNRQALGSHFGGLSETEVGDAFLGSSHVKAIFLRTEVVQEPLLGQGVDLGSVLLSHLLDSFVFLQQSGGILEGGNVVFHELVVHSLIASLGSGDFGLLLLDDQREVRVGGHLSGQFLILSTEALTSLVKAGLGASDGLVEEVDGEADSGLGRSSGGIIVVSFLALLALAVGRNPYFCFSEVLFPSIFMALLYS